jgi:hypothetical protein
MTIQYINGTRRNYGPRLPENQVGSAVVTFGNTREVAIDFDYAHLPGPNGPVLNGNVGQDIEVGETTGTVGTKYLDALVIVVPSYSQILSVRMYVDVAFVGGTSLKAGFVNTDNTAATNDATENGLFTATVGVTANLVIHNWIQGDGALIVPATSPTTNGIGLGAGADTANGAVGLVIKVTAAGTFTAGHARLFVAYNPPILSAT